MKEKDFKDKKPWGGRFREKTSTITEKISSSIHFDHRLFRQDIMGSMAHARMLCKTGILTTAERDAIIRGLTELRDEIERGDFIFSEKLEDIHMNIEAELTKRIGDAGKKLHTARSRNDQISIDLRLYILEESSQVGRHLSELIKLLVDMAERHMDVIMPGYTHLQVAQPVRFSHHLLSYCWAFLRDLERLIFFCKSCKTLTLGSGALAGVNYPTDREFLRKELGMDTISLNSMDAVSDRDFVLDFLYFSSVLGMHMSRMCEELVIWSSAEFSFVRLSDRVTTGSSIMPQKRNPDIAELIRGKTGRLYGNLMSLLTTMKALPLTYNRDFQEDKEPLFDSIDTVKLALNGMYEMFSSLEINDKNMNLAVYSNYSTATDLADYLAQKGVPFREAHEIIGSIVYACEKGKTDYFKLTSDDLKKFSSNFDDDVVEYLNPEYSTERKKSMGGTSRDEIFRQIEELRNKLQDVSDD